jgi:hypothetical protein
MELLTEADMCMGLGSKLGHDGSSLVIRAVVPLVLLVSLAGCIKGGSETTWAAESRSPDGKRVASAFTIEQSGFGTGWVQTTVYVNWTRGKQPKMLILAFSDGPSVPGGMNVGMNWLSPTHLELTYKGERPLDFQAVKAGGVDISVRVLPSEASSTNANWMLNPPVPPPFAYQKTPTPRSGH